MLLMFSGWSVNGTVAINDERFSADPLING